MGSITGGFEAGVPVRVAGDARVPVRRILGRNPGPMTGPGTNSYLIGEQRLALVDPGPADDIQFGNFKAAFGDGKLEWILVTHTHGDHSPGALKLQQDTGAELVGLKAPPQGRHDYTFQPDRYWSDGDSLDCGDFQIDIIHTPGHVSNHFCYLLKGEQLLFTGDHILQGTTSVILPPDGDMAAYMNSLHRLQEIPLRYLAPGHGEIIDDPQSAIAKLIEHRNNREHKVIKQLQSLGESDLDRLVLSVYDDVASHLIPWAKKTLLAHLLKLQREGRVSHQDDKWKLIAASS